MSSNIRVQRKCQHCGGMFIAKTTVTKFCGETCAKRDYKKRKREAQVLDSNLQTSSELQFPVFAAQSKDYLDIKDLSILVGLSRRTAYRLIKTKKLHALKIGNRYVIRRKDLDNMFEK
ncbi:MAG: helix-turn-helix domain-containing protein [Cyclobacteriaceae bacterium]